MRIISKFKDYYDSALAYGQDDSTGYMRQTRVIVREDLVPQRDLNDAFRQLGVSLPSLRCRQPEGWVWREGPDMGVLAFCGRAYPFYALTLGKGGSQINRDAVSEKTIFSWDKAFEDHVWQPPAYVRDEGDWREALAASAKADLTAWNLEHRSPAVVLMPRGHVGDRAGPEFGWPRIIVDPCLADFGFQKAVDPFAAFQEISMFLGGVLASTNEPPSPQTDREKVASHGFDPKYGFRKPPQR